MIAPVSLNPSAPGQGAIAIEVNSKRKDLIELVSRINDKETYDQFASYMSKHFAIKKSWLLDIQSVNLTEVFGATIGVPTAPLISNPI